MAQNSAFHSYRAQGRNVTQLPQQVMWDQATIGRLTILGKIIGNTSVTGDMDLTAPDHVRLTAPQIDISGGRCTIDQLRATQTVDAPQGLTIGDFALQTTTNALSVGVSSSSAAIPSTTVADDRAIWLTTPSQWQGGWVANDAVSHVQQCCRDHQLASHQYVTPTETLWAIGLAGEEAIDAQRARASVSLGSNEVVLRGSKRVRTASLLSAARTQSDTSYEIHNDDGGGYIARSTDGQHTFGSWIHRPSDAEWRGSDDATIARSWRGTRTRLDWFRGATDVRIEDAAGATMRCQSTYVSAPTLRVTRQCFVPEAIDASQWKLAVGSRVGVLALLPDQRVQWRGSDAAAWTTEVPANESFNASRELQWRAADVSAQLMVLVGDAHFVALRTPDRAHWTFVQQWGTVSELADAANTTLVAASIGPSSLLIVGQHESSKANSVRLLRWRDAAVLAAGTATNIWNLQNAQHTETFEVQYMAHIDAPAFVDLARVDDRRWLSLHAGGTVLAWLDLSLVGRVSVNARTTRIVYVVTTETDYEWLVVHAHGYQRWRWSMWDDALVAVDAGVSRSNAALVWFPRTSGWGEMWLSEASRSVSIVAWSATQGWTRSAVAWDAWVADARWANWLAGASAETLRTWCDGGWWSVGSAMAGVLTSGKEDRAVVVEIEGSLGVRGTAQLGGVESMYESADEVAMFDQRPVKRVKIGGAAEEVVIAAPLRLMRSAVVDAHTEMTSLSSMVQTSLGGTTTISGHVALDGSMHCGGQWTDADTRRTQTSDATARVGGSWTQQDGAWSLVRADARVEGAFRTTGDWTVLDAAETGVTRGVYVGEWPASTANTWHVVGGLVARETADEVGIAQLGATTEETAGVRLVGDAQVVNEVSLASVRVRLVLTAQSFGAPGCWRVELVADEQSTLAAGLVESVAWVNQGSWVGVRTSVAMRIAWRAECWRTELTRWAFVRDGANQVCADVVAWGAERRCEAVAEWQQRPSGPSAVMRSVVVAETSSEETSAAWVAERADGTAMGRWTARQDAERTSMELGVGAASAMVVSEDRVHGARTAAWLTDSVSVRALTSLPGMGMQADPPLSFRNEGSSAMAFEFSRGADALMTVDGVGNVATLGTVRARAPETDADATNKQYVDASLATQQRALLAQPHTWSDTQTFAVPPVSASVVTSDTQVPNKLYVDAAVAPLAPKASPTFGGYAYWSGSSGVFPSTTAGAIGAIGANYGNVAEVDFVNTAYATTDPTSDAFRWSKCTSAATMVDLLRVKNNGDATLAGGLTVAGNSAFQQSLSVIDPTSDTHATNKRYVAAQLVALKAAANEWSATQTFDVAPVCATAPAANNQLVNKQYTDGTFAPLVNPRFTGYVYVNGNGGAFPSTAAAAAIGANYSNRDGELNFVNTTLSAQSATQDAFRWSKCTSASALTDLLRVKNNGDTSIAGTLTVAGSATFPSKVTFAGQATTGVPLANGGAVPLMWYKVGTWAPANPYGVSRLKIRLLASALFSTAGEVVITASARFPTPASPTSITGVGMYQQSSNDGASSILSAAGVVFAPTAPTADVYVQVSYHYADGTLFGEISDGTFAFNVVETGTTQPANFVAFSSTCNTWGNVVRTGTYALTGAFSASSVTTSGAVSATGDVSGHNVSATGTVSATGDVSGKNMTATGNATVTGDARIDGMVQVTSGNLYLNNTNLNTVFAENGINVGLRNQSTGGYYAAATLTQAAGLQVKDNTGVANATIAPNGSIQSQNVQLRGDSVNASASLRTTTANAPLFLGSANVNVASIDTIGLHVVNAAGATAATVDTSGNLTAASATLSGAIVAATNATFGSTTSHATTIAGGVFVNAPAGTDTLHVKSKNNTMYWSQDAGGQIGLSNETSTMFGVAPTGEMMGCQWLAGYFIRQSVTSSGYTTFESLIPILCSMPGVNAIYAATLSTLWLYPGYTIELYGSNNFVTLTATYINDGATYKPKLIAIDAYLPVNSYRVFFHGSNHLTNYKYECVMPTRT